MPFSSELDCERQKNPFRDYMWVGKWSDEYEKIYTYEIEECIL
jgi:hypothetical protein